MYRSQMTRRTLFMALPILTSPVFAGSEAFDRDDGGRFSTNLIRAAQSSLEMKGYDPKGVDGILGPNTAAAIRAFQEEHDMPVTGTIDRRLLLMLGLIPAS